MRPGPGRCTIGTPVAVVGGHVGAQRQRSAGALDRFVGDLGDLLGHEAGPAPGQGQLAIVRPGLHGRSTHQGNPACGVERGQQRRYLWIKHPHTGTSPRATLHLKSASTASDALRAAISTGSHTGENGGA